MKLFRGRQGAAQEVAERAATPAGVDNGPVILLLDDRAGNQDPLEWAAAEAAARGSELRIVYRYRLPRVLDPVGTATVDIRARCAAETVVASAQKQARLVASEVRISTMVITAGQVRAVVNEARRSHGALVVIGRGRGFRRIEPALARRLARRTSASLAVIGLSHSGIPGPSAGRIVVGMDDDGGPARAVGFALRAARRRGTAVTVVHAVSSRSEVEDAIPIWAMAYPDVDIRRQFVSGPVAGAVLAESPAAALTVLGPGRHGWLHRAFGGSESYNVARLARGPVIMVANE